MKMQNVIHIAHNILGYVGKLSLVALSEVALLLGQYIQEFFNPSECGAIGSRSHLAAGFVLLAFHPQFLCLACFLLPRTLLLHLCRTPALVYQAIERLQC